jgi:hypothetical protein
VVPRRTRTAPVRHGWPAAVGALPLDTFRSGLHGSWIGLTRGGLQLCVTYARVDDDLHDWRAWILSEDHQRAEIIDIQVVDEDLDLLAPLRAHWPLDELANAHAVVVGAGSIGSHSNDALVSYGIRRLSLVDPDRLFKRNFARHLRTQARSAGSRCTPNATASCIVMRP